MPLYDYDCAACGRRIEVVHGVHAAAPAHCPNCGRGPLKKAITAAAVHFKGTGWAKRDRRVTVAPSAAKTSTDTAPSAEAGPDGGSAGEAAKPDTATTADAPASERSGGPSKSSGSTTATKAD